jgi:hypothetical protein
MPQMHELSPKSYLTLNSTMRKVQLLGHILTKLKPEIFACRERFIVDSDGKRYTDPVRDPERERKLCLVQANISADRTKSELALERHTMP